MDAKNQEIELKLPLENKEDIIEKLMKLGAKFISDVKQIDHLFNSPVSDFAKTGEAFRLRHEIFVKGEKAFLTYKDPATFSQVGHKIRSEYEVEVNDFDKMKQILEALHFELALKVEKVRLTYNIEDIIVAVDTLPFGDFLELEGDPDKSQALRDKLGLSDVQPIKKAYYDLQKEWNNNQ